MHRGQGGRRIDAELVGELGADVLEDGERVGLAARRAQRQHELAAQPLPQRVSVGQFPQPGHQAGALAQGQLRVDQVLGGGQPQLGQPGDRRGRERKVRDVGQRLAAPQVQRPPQQRGAARVVTAGKQLAAARHELREDGGVQLLASHREPVARRAELHAVAPGRPAQPGHQRLDRVRRVGGLAIGPQVVSQPLHRDRMALRDGEPDEQAAQPGAADGHDGAAGVPHFQRAEHADPHRGYLPLRLLSPRGGVGGDRRSRRSARSCSKSSALAGGGWIRPIRRPSSATSERSRGSASTRMPKASSAGLMSYRRSTERPRATAARSASVNWRCPPFAGP